MDDEQLKTHMLQRFKTAFEANAWLVTHFWPAYRANKMQPEKVIEHCPNRCAPDGSLLTVSQAWELERSGQPMRDRHTGELYKCRREVIGRKVYYLRVKLDDPPRS